MTTKTVLSKLEMIRIATYLQLNDNYDMVMIIQKNSSGIGNTTWARFFKSGYPDRYQEFEVTDYENW